MKKIREISKIEYELINKINEFCFINDINTFIPIYIFNNKYYALLED